MFILTHKTDARMSVKTRKGKTGKTKEVEKTNSEAKASRMQRKLSFY